jgi:hypothetical protein
MDDVSVPPSIMGSAPRPRKNKFEPDVDRIIGTSDHRDMVWKNEFGMVVRNAEFGIIKLHRSGAHLAQTFALCALPFDFLFGAE